MRDPSFYVSGLLDLHKLNDAAERRATWRQSMAALARAIGEDGPRPLDALHPAALVQGVRAALQSGLVDDLDWLEPATVGAALYELASALPLGPEQREIGRRVMTRLLSANAEAFAALATRMALGAGKGLSSAPTRARIALLTELPISLGVNDGPLALALVSRRELAREWIGTPSTESLPARRLAARLLERAAREAARRASQGDDHALRAFKSDTVAQAWDRLLADRESLVWRHVAVARGLLAKWVPEHRRALDAVLAANLSPTEWRRASASLAAYVAVDPDAAIQLASQALTTQEGGLLSRDPGAAMAMAWGLPRAAEAEPEAAGELLDWLMDRKPQDVAEATVDLRYEFGPSPFTDRAMTRALFALGRKPGEPGPALREREDSERDDGADALALEIARDLERAPRDDQPVRDLLAAALAAFANDGAAHAHGMAKDVLEALKGATDALDAVSPEDDAASAGRGGAMARRTSLVVLRDLDMSLLERDTLAHLLRLGPAGDAAKVQEESLDQVRERLATWILARESKPLSVAPSPAGRASPEPVRPPHPTLALRRLRALLHLVDGDMGDADDASRTAARRKRWLRIARALIDRFEREPASILRRTIVAALARAIDALVRAGVCDVSDVLLIVARHVEDPAEFQTLAEASMDPDLVHVLSRYAEFVAACAGPKLREVAPGMSLPPSVGPQSTLPEPARKLAAFAELARDLAPEGSGRSESLRAVLAKLHTSLSAVDGAPSLRALATSGGSEPDVIESLETTLGMLTQLAIGARGRLDPERTPVAPVMLGSSRPLSIVVSRVLSGAEPALRDHVVAACLDELVAATPKSIARLVSSIVWGVVELPLDRPSIESQPVKISDALPGWLPPRRTIGGFYVLRALSSGAVGSVFVVTRVEDRHDPNAERFALKVPEYSATAARSVSESEFLKMFRDEASALMAIPSHPNLARFVTFDAGARPKPILVMELVEGMTLDRMIESRALDTPKAFRALDDVLAGLSAMHAAGVGHLDLKPGNVIVRKGEEAVLVDFGLAGRHIRPGCATGPYGAPEVWGAVDGPGTPEPPPADVYAFGCVAYEVLTGKTLFQADSEMQMVALHIAHDGFPPPLRDLAARPGFAPICELLFACLRRDPKNRPTASALRVELKRVGEQLKQHKWPLS